MYISFINLCIHILRVLLASAHTYSYITNFTYSQFLNKKKYTVSEQTFLISTKSVYNSTKHFY